MDEGWRARAKSLFVSADEGTATSESSSLFDVGSLFAMVGAKDDDGEATDWTSDYDALVSSSGDSSQPTRVARPTLVGSDIHELREVLRFDVQPRWVLSRWSRVSTVREDQFTALRVPLVTGLELDDIAGSLTYYFDEQQTLQRIVFHGSTGDERKLVSLVEEAYKFNAEPSLRAGVYVARWNGNPTSAMIIDMAPVVHAETPHERLRVHLEINRPRAYVRLSEPMNRLMASHVPPRKRWFW
jgi:hypothetical protein